MSDIDHELQGYIDQKRRDPAQSEPRSFLAGSRSTVPADVMDPTVDLTQMRQSRAQEALERKLDQMVPLSIEETDEGPVFLIESKCVSCHRYLTLCSGPNDESEGRRPSLFARATAAGAVRHRRGLFHCDECIDRVEAEQASAKEAEKHRERVSLSKLDQAMQGFEFSQMILEEDRQHAVKAAHEWSSAEYPEPRGLCIFGDKGAGKTRLAATATWQRLTRHHVTWVSWPILLAQLGAAFNDSARAEAISVLTGKGALVLDDIAQEESEKVSDWARRQLFAAIDRRIQAGAPLLITTNLNPSAIGVVLGEKLMSRVVGYSRTLELPGRDMRLELNFDGSAKKGEGNG